MSTREKREDPARGPVPPRAWDALLFTVAVLVALVVALITGMLVDAQTHQVITSIIAGAVAFGATVERIWTIIRNFDRP